MIAALRFLAPLSAILALAAADESARPPNFVIILADDMGYGDAGCYGGTALKTPHLDRLAERGMRFTDFHSSGNVCSPTRAGLLTGRYQYRSGVDGVVNADPSNPAHHAGLQMEEFTFAEALKAKGYQVGLMGKWHVGYDPKYNPVHQGFDVFRGFVSGNIDFHSHYDRMGTFDWWHDLEKVKEKGYSTHLITKHALTFIEEHKDGPFCVYVAHEAVHSPWQGPEDPPVRGPDAEKGKGRTAAEALPAMMTAMDEGVGQIVAKLKELKLEDDTLVFFFSDNGPAGGSAGPLRGRKGSNWEGGHRVPGIAWWPGRIEAGAVTDQLAISLDLMPTLLELSGASADPARPLDGVSLVPLLMRGESLGERQLFWNHKAMRDGNWKLILGGKKGESLGLYDLSKDIGEKDNLAEKQPERVETMKAALKAWSDEVTSEVTHQPDVEAFKKADR